MTMSPSDHVLLNSAHHCYALTHTSLTSLADNSPQAHVYMFCYACFLLVCQAIIMQLLDDEEQCK